MNYSFAAVLVVDDVVNSNSFTLIRPHTIQSSGQIILLCKPIDRTSEDRTEENFFLFMIKLIIK